MAGQPALGISSLSSCVLLVLLATIAGLPRASVAAPTCSSKLVRDQLKSGKVQAHGVNLGSWLVVENWMSKSSPIFQNTAAADNSNGEFYVMNALGHATGTVLFEQHRSQMYSEQDFADMAAAGVNLARLPIGYWIKEFDHSGGNENAWKVYAAGAKQHLQNALDWGCARGVAVLPVLHAAKGSQNGQEHSAPTNIGHVTWQSSPENIQDSIDTVDWLAQTFGGHPAFLGVDMLNEPSTDIPTATLQKYYTDTYKTVRAHSDCILVHAPILQTQQKPGAAGNWESFMPPPQYTNVWHTWHLYYAYDGDANSAISSGVPADSQKIQQWSGNYLLIGEWSLATHTAASNAQMKQLASEELQAYGKAHAGYTFWAWKWFNNANGGGWTLNKSLQNGIITYPS